MEYLIFIGYDADDSFKESLGWTVMTILAMTMTINFAVTMGSTIILLYKKCKAWKLKQKNKYLR